MSTAYAQLPLAINVPQQASFESFIPGNNALLIDLLKQTALTGQEQQLYVWSEPGAGKTHLLQASCQLAAGAGRRCCYLPLDQLVQHSIQLLDNLEFADLLCIDALDAIAKHPAWEQALFSLINRSRTLKTSLVFASRTNLNGFSLQLADLRSRLAWGPTFSIQPISDADKQKFLIVKADQLGLELSEEVGAFLINRYPRDMHSLSALLQKLNMASLAAKRKITIPFIKSILE